jgi:Cd2+/Zn2+-exporting ATPase
VHVSIDGIYAGHIVISDRVKADAAEAVAALHHAGVRRTVMLTGDQPEIAAAVATAVGVDDFHAGLLPADKVAQIEALLHNRSLSEAEAGRSLSESKGRTEGAVAFVGDGINDAPVLARADLGIAMGALGSDAAIEAADVVLMDDKPSKVAEAVRIARRTLRIARENMVFAIGVKVLVLLLAAVGAATLWMAVFADVGVTVLAVLNAMRALKV